MEETGSGILFFVLLKEVHVINNDINIYQNYAPDENRNLNQILPKIF